MKELRTSLNTILTQAMAMEAMVVMDLNFDSNAHLFKKQFPIQLKMLPLALYFLLNSICLFVFWSPIPCIFQKCMLNTLETTFHDQTTFCLVGGSLSWSANALFSCGGTLTNGAKVASERQYVRKKLFFFKQLYLGN